MARHAVFPLRRPDVEDQNPPDAVLMYRVRVVVDDHFPEGREEMVVSGHRDRLRDETSCGSYSHVERRIVLLCVYVYVVCDVQAVHLAVVVAVGSCDSNGESPRQSGRNGRKIRKELRIAPAWWRASRFETRWVGRDFEHRA